MESGECVRELRPHLWRPCIGVVNPFHRHLQHPIRIACADAAHIGVAVKLDLPFVMT